MRKLMLLLCVGAVLILSAGCTLYRAPVMPPVAGLVTSVEMPLTTNVGPNTPVSTKQGSATVMNVLGILTVGNAGLDAAAKDGGLQQIHYADYSYFNLLWIFQTFTTTAYGE